MEEAAFVWSVFYVFEDCAEGGSTMIEDLGIEFNERLSWTLNQNTLVRFTEINKRTSVFPLEYS